MSTCHLSHNGQPSELAASLDTLYGPDIRDRVMSYIYSPQFIDRHGSFRNPLEADLREDLRRSTQAMEDSEIESEEMDNWLIRVKAIEAELENLALWTPSMPVNENTQEPTLEWVQETILNKKVLRPVEQLSPNLLGFLKSLNVSVEFMDDLKSRNDFDATSMTDLLYKTVLVRNDWRAEGLLQETAYVALSFLGRKNKLRAELLRSIENLPGYQEKFAEYRRSSKTLSDYKINELIAVDFLAEAIKNDFTNPQEHYLNKNSEYYGLTQTSKLGRKLEILLLQFKNFIERLFGIDKLSEQEVRMLLQDIAHDVLTNNLNKYNTALDPDQQLVNYEETIAKDPKANDIVTRMQTLGVNLTGSLALRKVGTLYRSDSETLHDLDFIYDGNTSRYTMEKDEELLKLIRDMQDELRSTPPEQQGAVYKKYRKIANDFGRSHSMLKDIQREFPSFKFKGVFINQKNNCVTVMGDIDGYHIDVFLSVAIDKDQNERGFQSWESIFEAKLAMGRMKDIRDFANYVPFETTPEIIGQHAGLRHFTFKGRKRVIKDSVDFLMSHEAVFSDVTLDMFNEQQKEAFDRIMDFATGKTPGISTFSLRGYAGTGKTTMTKFLLREFAARGMQTVVASPTHRAKEVLIDATNRPAMTVAKLLGLQPGMELEGFNLENKLFQARKSDNIPSNGLVIIDEVSLLNDALTDHIVSIAKKKGAKILFIGDDGQIKPVKQRTKSKALYQEASAELTKVMRTTDGNPMPAEVLQPIRDNPTSGSDKFEHTTKLNSGQGIRFTADSVAFIEAAKTSFRKMFQTGNYMHSRMTAYTRRAVAHYNREVRRDLFGDSVERIVKGELLMMYENCIPDFGEWRLPNGMDLRVAEVERTSTTVQTDSGPVTMEGYTMTLVSAKKGEYRETMFSPDFVPLAYLNTLKRLHAKAIASNSAADRDKSWKEYYTYSEKVFNSEDYYVYKGEIYQSEEALMEMIKRDQPNASMSQVIRLKEQAKMMDRKFNYGYATTVHKIQGGTYEEIYVDENDIDLANRSFNGEPADIENWNALKYVAFSRSSRLTTSLSLKTTPGTPFNIAPPPPAGPAPSLPPVTETQEEEKDVYEEVGTYYRLRRVGDSAEGEYRQGTSQEWKPLSKTTARVKYEKFVGPLYTEPVKETKKVAPPPAPTSTSTQTATYKGLITDLKEGEVFVFGSNPLGVNGNPEKFPNMSASVATKNGWVEQGEKMDNKMSASGKAWGLTTVTGPGEKKSLTGEQITTNIQKLYQEAQSNPGKRYLVAYTGTGTNNNGYTNTEMAQFFSAAGPIPANVVFEEGFATLLTKRVAPPPTVVSKTPVFDSLPKKSSTRTMTYAGIGSRQTPTEVLGKMTEAAKKLESLGYTLRSGGADGADKAFEEGVTSKKEIFGGFDSVGDREVKIAHEIHPDLKGAMEASKKRANAAGKNGERSAWAVQNLMARNTNQVFGKNLDTPVDFVLFYAVETENPLRPKGGTGQAVEMARRKGIPTINMADSDWEAQLEKVLSKRDPIAYIGTNGIPTFMTPTGLDYAAYQKYAEENGYLYPLRKGGYEHFGNPFSAAGKGETINMGSVEAAVAAYRDWVTGTRTEFTDKDGVVHKDVSPAQRNWILKEIESGKWKGKTILYWSNKNGLDKLNHSHALYDLINGVQKEETSTATLPQSISGTTLGLEKSKRLDLTEAKVKAMRDAMRSMVELAKANPQETTKLFWTNPANRKTDDYGFRAEDYIMVLDDLRMEYGDDFPKNITYTEAVEIYMANNPMRLLQQHSEKMLEFDHKRSLIRRNETQILEMMNRLEVPIVNEAGDVVGTMAEKYGKDGQDSAADAIFSQFLQMYNAGNQKFSAPQVLGQILLALKGHSMKEGPRQGLYKDMVGSFAYRSMDPKRCLLDDVFDKLSQLNYRISVKDKRALKDYFYEKKLDPSYIKADLALDMNLEESKSWEEDRDRYLQEALDSIDEVDDRSAKMLRDWRDSAFSMSTKEQATARTLMFIANQLEMENYDFSVSPAPGPAVIDISHIQDINDLTIGVLRTFIGKKVFHSGYQSTPKVLEDKIRSKYPRIPKLGVLGAKTVDFNSLYDAAQGTLSTINKLEQNLDKLLEVLENNDNPNLAELGSRIRKLGPAKKGHVLRGFIKVMNMNYNRFNIASYKKGKKNAIHAVYSAQRYNQKLVIMDRWQQYLPFSKVINVLPNGERQINTQITGAHAYVIEMLAVLNEHNRNSEEKLAKMQTIAEEARTRGFDVDSYVTTEMLEGIIAEEVVAGNGKYQEDALKRPLQKQLLSKMFAMYGMDLHPKAFESMAGYYKTKKDGVVDRISGLVKGTELRGGWTEQYTVSASSGKPAGFLSSFFYKAAGRTKTELQEDVDTELRENRIQLNNPMMDEQTSMKILASLQLPYEQHLYSSMHKDVEGKNRWDFSLHTSLSRIMQDIASEGTTIPTLSTTVWGGAWHLAHLGKVELDSLEGLKVGTDQFGTTREGMSDREQLLTSLIFFQNQGRDTANMFSLTHSDKTHTPLFKNIQKVKVLTDTGLHEEAIDAFMTMFQGEHLRIQQVQKIKKERGSTGNENMDNSGEHFLLFPFLEKDRMSNSEVLWNPDGSVKQNLTDEETKIVRAAIQNFLRDNLVVELKNWERNGISLEMFNKNYINKLKNMTSKEVTDRKALLRRAATDYTINSLLWNMSSTVLLMGDPANAAWKGSVEATMAEAAKRLAKDIAPGQQLMFEDTVYNQLTLQDVQERYDYLEKLGSNITHAKEAANAQELTTVLEHLKVMYAAEKLTEDEYKNLVEKYNKGEDFSTEDLDLILENNGSPMNPMKPVYAGARYQDGLIHYDYIKTSSYPLLPQFTRNTELDKFRLLMESKYNGVERFPRTVFLSGSKMGSGKNLAKVFEDTTGKFIQPDEQTLIRSTRELKREHFRIQQEVPFDNMKDHVTMITQMDKLLVHGILEMEKFKLRGKSEDFTGEQMRQRKEDVRVRRAELQLAKLRKALQYKDGKIAPAKVVELILQSARENEIPANDMMYLESLLKSNVDGTDYSYPLFLQTAVDKFSKLLMAKVKAITEFDMPGKSFVQGAGMGLVKDTELSEYSKNSIVTVGDYDFGQPLRHAEVLADGTVKPAQVIMPFNFFNGKTKLKLKDFMEKDADGNPTNRLDMSKIPAELLQVVTARIPNQGHNSMLPVEVVGFTPEWMGDLIIVPGSITEQMGSDFDVDKLYTYMRPTSFDPITGKLSVWTPKSTHLGKDWEDYERLEGLAIERLVAAYEAKGREVPRDTFGNPSFPEDVLYATAEVIAQGEESGAQYHKTTIKDEGKRKESMQLEYFDIHWGVLTHPEVFHKMASKLDTDDLKNANELLKGKPKGQSFFSPGYQLEMFQSGKDAKGLVGLTSLSTTSNANLENKSLQLGGYKIDDGRLTPEQRPINLDNKDFLYISGEALSKGWDSTDDKKTWYSKHTKIVLYQSGALDNAKNRFLDNLNISMAAYPALDVLLRLSDKPKGGEGLSVRFGALFMAQQVLQDFSQESRRISDSLSEEDAYGDTNQEVIAILEEKYKIEYLKLTGEGMSPQAIADTRVTEANLEASWNSHINETKDGIYYIRQMAILRDFERMLALGQRLRELNKTVNQDTNGAGPDIIYALQQRENASKMMEPSLGKMFLGEDTLLTGQHGEIFNLVIPTALQLLETVFPVAAIESTIQQIAASQGKAIGDLSGRVQQEIVRSMRAYMISTSPAITVDPETQRMRLLFRSDKNKSLAQRVLEAKEKYPNDEFLKRINGVTNVLSNGPDYINVLNQGVDRGKDSQVVKDFTRMLISDDRELQLLGEDLVLYTQLLTPLPGSNSIAGMVPAGYVLGTDITTHLQNIVGAVKALDGMPNGFIDQLYQHKPSLAFAINDKVIAKAHSFWMVEGRPEYPETLVLNASDAPQIKAGSNFRQYLQYRSAEEGKTILYKLRSDTKSTAVYQRIDTLGKGAMTEYDSASQGPARSIFKENRAANLWKEADEADKLQYAVRAGIFDTSDKDNVASRWGFSVGIPVGESQILDGLKQLSADPEVPTFLRTLGASLAQRSQGLATVMGLPALTLTVENRQKMGSYHTKENAIRIAKNQDINKVAKTLLHEILHQRQVELLERMGYMSTEAFVARNAHMSEDVVRVYLDQYLKTSDEFAEAHPVLREQLRTLDRMRVRALEQKMQELRAAGKDADQMLKDVYANKASSDPDAMVLYGLSRLTEFTVTLMTEPNVMRFLNTVDNTETKSWLNKLIDTFLEFLTSVVEIMGVPLNEKSILKECLAISYDITGLDPSQTLLLDSNLRVQNQVIMMDNQADADTTEDLLTSVYNSTVKRTDTPLAHFLEVSSESPLSNGGPSFFGNTFMINQATAKVRNQLQVLEHVMARSTRTDADKKRRAQAELLHAEVERDFDAIQKMLEDKELTTLAMKQLQWVEGLFKRPFLHMQEITVAWSVLDTWRTIQEVYQIGYEPSDEDRERISKVASLANELFNRMLVQSVKTVTTELEKETTIKLTPKDFTENLKDLDILSAEFVNWERDSNRLSQAVTTYSQIHIERVKGEQQKLLKDLKRFKDLVPKDMYEAFFQETEDDSVFGLVQRVSPEWFIRDARAKSDLSRRIYGTGKNVDKYDPTTQDKYLKIIRKRFRDFWADALKSSLLVDVTKLLDLNTGEVLNTPEALAEIARLKSLGVEELVDTTIDRASKDFQRYLSKREAEFERIDNSGLTQFDADEEKKIWESRNSPQAFLKTEASRSTDITDFMHEGRHKAYFVPINKAENLDKKYEVIQADPRLKEGYDILTKWSRKLRDYMPPQKANSMHDNFMPIVHPGMIKEGTDFFSKMKGTKVGRLILDATTITQEEKDRALQDATPDKIPLPNTQVPRIKDKKGKRTSEVDFSAVSKDIPRIFEMFGNMAIHYRHMYETGEMLDTVEKLITQENTQRGNSGKKGLNNLLAVVNAYRDAHVYKISRRLEAIDGTPIYSTLPWKHYKAKEEVVALEAEQAELQTKLIMLNLSEYEQETNPDYLRYKEIADRLKELQGEARYWAGSKVADTMISIQQLKSMSYNPFSAMSNYMFGYMAVSLHAAGFRADTPDGFTKGDFTPKQFARAYRLMKENILTSLSLRAYEGGPMAKKIRAVITRVGSIEALIDTTFGDTNLSEDKSKVLNAIDPYAAQKSGDFLNKGAAIIARALNVPVQVTVNGETKTISLFDALNEEGEWDSAQYGENKTWNSENVEDEIGWQKFAVRTRKILTIIFGSQDKNMSLKGRRSMWLRLIGQFRMSWLPEAIKTRWGNHQGYDEVLEREVEGRYRTMLKFDWLGIPILTRQLLSVATGNNPFEDVKVRVAEDVVYYEGNVRKTKKKIVYRPIKEHEIENMRRNLKGLAYTSLALAMYLMAKAAIPDEEELRRMRSRGMDTSTAARIAANLAYRNFQDLIMYTNPGIFQQITGTIAPSYAVFDDVRKGMLSWFKLMYDEDYTWKQHWLKQTKMLPGFNLYNKMNFYATGNIASAAR